MKINKAIVATDNNKIYTECWPLITKGWKNINNIETVVATVGNCNLDTTLGYVIKLKPIDGIPNGFVSQVVRFIIPAFFPEEICILSDIDMLPLSKKYFVKKLEKFNDNSIVVLTADAYGVDDKFPMCYIAAKGKYFQSIIGLKDTSEGAINAFIQMLFNLNLGWNTDETFLGKCIKANIHNHKFHFLNRCKKFPFKQSRIDRSDWKINKIKLLQNKYIDSHLVRPVSEYTEELKLLNLYLDNNNNGFKALVNFIKKDFK